MSITQGNSLCFLWVIKGRLRAISRSSRVAGAPFLNLNETAELSTLTNVVDVLDYRKLLR
jgi:hypothetical protein